jgi:hypothetical protein
LLSLVAIVVTSDLMWFEFACIVAALIQFIAIDLITDLM